MKWITAPLLNFNHIAARSVIDTETLCGIYVSRSQWGLQEEASETKNNCSFCKTLYEENKLKAAVASMLED